MLLRTFWLFLIALCLSGTTFAKPLKVGVAGSSPYVTHQGELDGLSLRVWRNIAEDRQWDYTLVDYPNLEALEKAVQEGSIDVGVGPIPVDSQVYSNVDLSQPYYTSQIALASLGPKSILSGVFSDLLSYQAAALGALLIATTFAVAWLVWRFERKKNPTQFPPSHIGYFNSLWFTIVTMTTVGYGDQSPVTRAGRWLTGIWMVAATTLFSALVAVIATQLTLAHTQAADIDNLSALKGRRIGVVAGSDSYNMASLAATRILTYSNVEQAFLALETGSIEGVLSDELEMEYVLAQHPKSTFRLVQLLGHQEYFAFAVPVGSPLRRELDLSIIGLRESGRLRLLRTNWLASLSQEGRSRTLTEPNL